MSSKKIDRKEVYRTAKIGFLAWLGIIVVTFIFITISFCLPNGRIRSHLAEASGILVGEGEHPSSYIYNPSVELDNYSDAIILNVAYDVKPNRNPIKKALSNTYFTINQGTAQGENYKEVVENTDNLEGEFIDYTRYWFTTSAFVRFLGTVMGYKQIRFAFMTVILLLFGISISLIHKRVGIKYAISMAIALILIRLFIIPMSIQYVPVTLITLLSIIAVCVISKKKNYMQKMPLLFIVSGTTTAIFDLMSFPLLTLGLPLALLVVISLKEDKKVDVVKYLKLIVGFTLLWGLCYGATYFSKWIISSIILQENSIMIALEQLVFRSSASSLQVSTEDMFTSNFNTYFTGFSLIGLLVYFVIWIVLVIKLKKPLKGFLPFVIMIAIALIPYAWYLAFTNHSYIHYWMTYRIQAIALFSILSGSLLVLENPIKNPSRQSAKKH